jgi:pimeloyl-ACP methyl ester carboxylesterase
MRAEGTVERPDGRSVAWTAWGVEGGRRLLQLHGTPGSRVGPTRDLGVYERLNANVVTFDRPGYGQSTPQRDRTILSVADDALAIADRLEWDRFSVLGISGGGPHALAVGVRAPERVLELGLAVGGPPPELVDPDDLIAINREGRRRAEEEGRESLEAFLAEPASQIPSDPLGVIESAMADAPPVDREMLKRADVREVLAASLREAFANGPLGWYDDSWRLSTPWDFDLEDVVVPVHMWYGALDRNVPIRAVEAMAARLTVASFEIIPGAGHLGWLAHEERVLQTLLEPTAERDTASSR